MWCIDNGESAILHKGCSRSHLAEIGQEAGRVVINDQLAVICMVDSRCSTTYSRCQGRCWGARVQPPVTKSRLEVLDFLGAAREVLVERQIWRLCAKC